MHHIQQMLKTHPRQSQVDMQALISCIQECFDCAQSCTACADACLGEQNVQMLIRCIRLNLDCADVCSGPARCVALSVSGMPNIMNTVASAPSLAGVVKKPATKC